MRKLLYLIILIGFIQFGCASKNIISANLSNIAPLKLNASFTHKVNVSDNDSPYTMREDDMSFKLMWDEITTGFETESRHPEYFFDISLLYTQSFALTKLRWSPKYYSSAIFKLKSYGKNRKLINSELFKTIGMWNDGIGSLNGPVKVSAFN